MQDTRSTIKAFLSLRSNSSLKHPDLMGLIVQLAATTPAIHYVFDLDAQSSVFLNRIIYDTLCYTREANDDLQSDLLLRLMHPEDLKKLIEMLEQFDTATDEEIICLEYRLRHADGGWCWFSSRSVVFQRDEGGRPTQILTTAQDISAQKHSEALLRESEARLHMALENTGLGMWDWDIASNEVEYGNYWQSLLGYSSEELSQRVSLVEKMVHPDDLKRIREDLQRTFDSDDFPYDVEYRTLHKSGRWMWVNSRGKVQARDAEGKPLRMIGTMQDITRRKQMQESLRESEEQFRGMFRDAATGIAVTTAEGQYLEANSAYLNMLGCTEDEIRNLDFISLTHPDDREHKQVLLKELLSGERESFFVETRYVKNGGGFVWCRVSMSVGHDAEGHLSRIISIAEDITEQKALQEHLFESQKLESMGRLAGGIAHDFNNLLTAILGYTALSLASLPEEAEVRSFLSNVSGAAERAAELTKQLLMYARRQMVEFTVIDIKKVILDMYPLLRRTIGEQYELVTVLSEDKCNVNANASQLEQVLTNLVVNARDSMPNGGRILIETSCMTLENDYVKEHIGVMPGEYVMFSVSDNGMGMTREVQDRIFEPFYTTKEVGKGTGLGLATCYGIVKQSKGNIWVYSEPGKGTTFKVYLPRVLEASHSEPVKLPDNLPEGIETVLLVDDEPMVRDIAARTLRGKGYRVLEASNGAEALHLQSEWPGEIDLLVTDVVMPLMGGKELGQRLQELRPDMKVLYMSGYTQNVVLQQGVLKQGVVLLTKPFTAEGLFRKVREALKME